MDSSPELELESRLNRSMPLYCWTAMRDSQNHLISSQHRIIKDICKLEVTGRCVGQSDPISRNVAANVCISSATYLVCTTDWHGSRCHNAFLVLLHSRLDRVSSHLHRYIPVQTHPIGNISAISYPISTELAS